MATWDEVRQWVEEYIEYVKQAWGNGHWWAFFGIAKEGVALIDKVFDALSGLSEAEIIDGLAEILDDLVPLPFYLELVDGPAFRAILQVVFSFLKKIFGDNWIKVLAEKIS